VPAAPPSKEYFPLLDVLRGPAALLVFFEHWRNLLFRDFADLNSPGVLLKVFYLFTGAGHEAVMVFFVLSGCVIAHVIHTMRQRGKWSWSGYLSARLTRLWVVLIPALLLTAVWDRLGSGMGGAIYAGGGFGNILHAPVADTSGLLIFFGNVFFLQKILVPTFGSNGPLWSISYEFIYYLVYPALILAFAATTRSWVARVAGLALAIALLVFSGAAIASAFPIWLAGVGAYRLFLRHPVPARWSAPGFILGVLALLGCIVGSRSGHELPYVHWNWLLAVTCAFAIYCGLSAQLSERTLRLLKPLHGLSDISYSLYLLHMPVFIFIASRLFATNTDRWMPDARHFALAIPIALAVFAYAVVVWFFTEHQTGRVRKLLAPRR
jgi:peptidoglycan/LPS O-acetylase OafA/YrhL